MSSNIMDKYDLDELEQRRQRLLAEKLPPAYAPSREPADLIFPGVDRNAPPLEKLEQLEQQITKGLQDIEALTARGNELTATRLLPAIKKIAVASVPAREACKWWLDFFSATANINIPTEFEEYEDEGEGDQEDQLQQEDEAELGDNTASRLNEVSYAEEDESYSNATPEGSFLPGGQGNLMSSTPARPGFADASYDASNSSDAPSWLASESSRLARLRGEVDALIHDDPADADVDTTADSIIPGDSPTIPRIHIQAENGDRDPSGSVSALPSSRTRFSSHSPKRRGGRAKPVASPLLRGVLKQNLRPTAPDSPHSRKRISTTLKQNPYADQSGKHWDGIVDISDPTIRLADIKGHDRDFEGKAKQAHFGNVDDSSASLDQSAPTPANKGKGKEKASKTAPPSQPTPRAPRTMADMGLAPKLGQTPRKAAARQITNEMLKSIVDSRQKPLPARYAAEPKVANLKPAPTPKRKTATIKRQYAAEESDTTDFGSPKLVNPQLYMKYLPADQRANFRGDLGLPVDSSTTTGTMTPVSGTRYFGRVGATPGGADLSRGAYTPTRGFDYGDGDEDSPMPTPPSISKYAHLLAMEDAGTELKWDDVDDAMSSPRPSAAGISNVATTDNEFDDGDGPTDTFRPGGLNRYLQAAQQDPPSPESTTGDLPSVTRYQQGYVHRQEPTPPSAATSVPSVPTHSSRYSRDSAESAVTGSAAPSLRTMMRNVGLDLPGFSDTSSASVQDMHPAPQQQMSYLGGEPDDSFSSGGDDSFGDTMQPMAVGMVQRVSGGDQSFDSSSTSSSFDDDMQAQPRQMQFVARSGDGLDDSFDDSQDYGPAPQMLGIAEDTVFGLPPQRAGQGALRMLGDGQMQTVHYGLVVDEMEIRTPTPAWMQAQDE